jgi:hypothetical protein
MNFIVLPRQARDKHGKKLTKRTVFPQLLNQWDRCGHASFAMPIYLYLKTPNICQDRLGTNIGIVERKRDTLLQGNTDAYGRA